MSEARQIAFPFTRATEHVAAPKDARVALARPAPSEKTAIRIPAGHQQAELCFPEAGPQIFVHEGARQLLERRLEAIAGHPLHVLVTDNRHSMVSARRRNGVLTIRLHHMFLSADPFTLRAIVQYTTKATRAASDVLGKYIEAHRQLIVAEKKRPAAIRTTGAIYDIGQIFDELNAKYFQGLVDAQITWGEKSPKGRRRRRSIRLGTYCTDQKLIRVHPKLDQDFVPRYFVEFVIYHEMLHHIVPMPLEGGRRIFHSREFRMREKRFEYFERAQAWEKRHIGKLLGQLR